MGELSRIGMNGAEAGLARRSSAELSLAIASGRPLPDDEFDALEHLMKETQAHYPKQELPPGTPDMWLARWEEMAARYGLPEFRAALLKAITDRNRPPFFPEPQEIEGYCAVARRQSREAAEARARDEELARAREQCRREREEDVAVGGHVLNETEIRLNALLAAAAPQPRGYEYRPPPGHDPRGIADRVRAELAVQGEVRPQFDLPPADEREVAA